jgi:hypothetical protein
VQLQAPHAWQARPDGSEDIMSRRKLLTEDERAHLFGIPIDEAGLARHYTLSPDDLELLHAKRGARNILGAAVQLALLRHPGFGLRSDEVVSDALLRYLAEQLGVPVSAFRHYAARAQTRQDHAQEFADRLGLRLSRRGDLPLMMRHATDAAAATDKGAVIVGAVVDGIRAARIVLPSPHTLERVGLAGRARARKLAADTLIAPLTAEQITGLDALLVNDPALKRSPLAWLRDVPEAPGASNLNEIIERLTYVRKIRLDPKLADSIHDHRFRQLVREGAVAPSFLLSDYSLRRRRATLTAQAIDLETRLADTAVEMFDKLIGSLFTKANKRPERRYQATTRDVGRLMRLFDKTIYALTGSRDTDADPFAAIDATIGWRRLLDAKPQAKALAEMVNEDTLVAAAENYSGYQSHRQQEPGAGCSEGVALSQSERTARGAGRRADAVQIQAMEGACPRRRQARSAALRDRRACHAARSAAVGRCLDRTHPQLSAVRRIPAAACRRHHGRRRVAGHDGCRCIHRRARQNLGLSAAPLRPVAHQGQARRRRAARCQTVCRATPCHHAARGGKARPHTR